MRINPTNLIPENSVSRTGGKAVPDQGASFAEKLDKATTAAKQATTSKASQAAQTAEDAKLKTACKEMEAVFLNLMLSQMRATVPKNNLLGNSSEEQMLTSMLDTELTKNMAQAGGMGLADMLYRQLSKTAAATKGQAAR